MNKKRILLLFIALLITKQSFCMENENFDPMAIDQKKIAELFKDLGKNAQRSSQSRTDRINAIRNEIKDLCNDVNITESSRNIQIQILQSKLKEIEKHQDLENKLDNVAINLVGQWGNAAIGHVERKANEKMELRNMLVKEKLDNEGKSNRLKILLDNIFDKKNLTMGGLAITGASAGIAGVYYGSKLGYRYIDAKIGKPSLIRESSRKSWRNAFKEWFKTSILGYEIPQANLQEVIMAPEMAQKMQMLADDAKNSFDNGLPFRNSLFYGLPGTGKTMFAKKLALYCDMDYAIMSGADFAQFKEGEGITELHKLFDWAENSQQGMLIFIDEADAFLRDRRVLNNQERNLVNAFLSRTGTSSNKFSIILASNYEDELDPAVLSRVHKKINFPLPSQLERIKIIKLYFDKYVLNDQRSVYRNGQKIELSITVDENINEEVFTEVAQKIDGFSGREIEQMISELRIATYNIGQGTLTKDIIDQVVDEKIEEHKHAMEASEFQRNRQNAALGIQNKEPEIQSDLQQNANILNNENQNFLNNHSPILVN